MEEGIIIYNNTFLMMIELINVGTIKLKLPKFYGKTNPEEYLEWEKTVESVFNCHNFGDEKKVLLCIAQFKQYAQIWWDKLM